MLVSGLVMAAALQSEARPGPPPLIVRTPPPVIRVAPPAPPPPPPPPPRDLTVPARSRANLASYITDEDYPAEAIRNDEQGLAAFRLLVGVDGRVLGCAITQSSGSASLDETTCSIMQRRPRFTPAIAQGRPVIGTVAARIRWQLASEPRPRRSPDRPNEPVLVQRARPVQPLTAFLSHRDFPAAARGSTVGVSRFRLAIGPDGRVTDCSITVPNAVPALDATACRLMQARAHFTPARDDVGNPIVDVHWGHIDWRAFEHPPAPRPPMQ